MKQIEEIAPENTGLASILAAWLMVAILLFCVFLFPTDPARLAETKTESTLDLGSSFRVGVEAPASTARIAY